MSIYVLSITQASQKIRTQWKTFCFKKKTQLQHVADEWNKYKKGKKWQGRSGKKDSSEDIFRISFNHSQRNTKNKFWLDVSVNLSENIPAATETKTKKFSMYLLGMSNHIFKFIFQTSQYPFVASLCCYVYFKFLFFKKNSKTLEGQISLLRNFRKRVQKLYF